MAKLDWQSRGLAAKSRRFLNEERANEITRWLDEHLNATVAAIREHVEQQYQAMQGKASHEIPHSIAHIEPPAWARRRRA